MHATFEHSEEKMRNKKPWNWIFISPVPTVEGLHSLLYSHTRWTPSEDEHMDPFIGSIASAHGAAAQAKEAIRASLKARKNDARIAMLNTIIAKKDSIRLLISSKYVPNCAMDT